MPSTSLLDDTLRTVIRRYRLPAITAASGRPPEPNPATALAVVIEQAREALARGTPPEAALKDRFLEALERMIREAMRAEAGDPVFQATVLRHQDPRVREYASLAAHASQDRRRIHAAVNAIAHPARQQLAPEARRETLAQLHEWARAESWPALHDQAERLLAMPGTAQAPQWERGLRRLLAGGALERLRRLQALGSDARVQRYQALWDRNGPRSGSAHAVRQGSASHQRGAAVEALARVALEALARRLEQAEGLPASYRVVTSMRVPAAIPAAQDRAKTEWDAVLLKRASHGGAAPAWDVCLLVEAKASVDAAASDLPRLLRGLHLLAHADTSVAYPFKTQQGMVSLRGASLGALGTGEADLARTVLYCSDAGADTGARLLSAASRMQLLCAPASVAYASGMAGGGQPGRRDLDPVWTDLLGSARWHTVLHQYPMLRRARELMVHTDDLLAAIACPAG